MFGTGLLKGLGITFKHLVDTYKDDMQSTPARYQGSDDRGKGLKVIDQPVDQEGLLTIQYPEERRLLPERFRYIPMLIWDTETDEERCTACGICAKVCPPQCIWITRATDEAGKPVTRPQDFFIDATICMSCNYCVEFCPFDAIKMGPRCRAGIVRAVPPPGLRQGRTHGSARLLRRPVADPVRRGTGTKGPGGRRSPGQGRGPRPRGRPPRPPRRRRLRPPRPSCPGRRS